MNYNRGRLRKTINMKKWILESLSATDESLGEYPIDAFPYSIGRHSNLSFGGSLDAISRHHAEIDLSGRDLVVRDLGSTNGTFVNQRRIDAEQRLLQGDQLRIADSVFRIHYRAAGKPSTADRTSEASDTERRRADRRQASPGDTEFLVLLNAGAVTAEFQPIVSLSDNNAYGVECLGRGCHDPLPQSPSQLFDLAESFDRAVDLSELMRREGLILAQRADIRERVFVNTHPSELRTQDRLIADLQSIRKRFAKLEIVLEIHEHAVTAVAAMRELRSRLTALGIGLAFDDFGTGQARLLELVEAEPDFVKFDKSLVGDLDRADERRRRVVASLVEIVKELGIATIAEGVTREAEADACREAGFEFAQGYYFAGPATLRQTGASSRE